MKNIVNFLFEVGILSKTPRSGFHFLGSGNQSVSEHTTRTIFVGYALAALSPGVDLSKVLIMCLFHDLAESRISDLNHVHQKYIEAREHDVIKDVTSNLAFGKHMNEIISEYEKRESPEAVLAKDADVIEWILSLKEEHDIGNTRAKKWIPVAVERLKTDVAFEMVEKIMETESNEWWFKEQQGA